MVKSLGNAWFKLPIFAASFWILCYQSVFAGTISDAILTDTIKHLDPLERAAKGGMQVSMWVIVFYIFYLTTIWSFVYVMLATESALQPTRRPFAKNLSRANMFLAAGDTAMFLAFLVAFLFADSFSNPDSSLKLQQLLLLGVFSTSLTMSVYYLYIAFYFRDRFLNGATSIFIVLIFGFFVARLLLHYNPENVWFSMMLPPGQPNYSAWLRNIPLFLYGLLAIGAIAWGCWNASGSTLEKKIDACILGAMICLLASFVLYGLDVFYSHKIDRKYIWIIYTFKTLAYMGAFVLFWLGEFKYGRDVATENK